MPRSASLASAVTACFACLLASAASASAYLGENATGFVATHTFEAAEPRMITLGEEGDLWYSLAQKEDIGRLTLTGGVTEYAIEGCYAEGIATGPEGDIWFTARSCDAVGRVTPGGVVTIFRAGITLGSEPNAIASGPEGDLWFTQPATREVGRITPAGTVTEFSLGGSGESGPYGIVEGAEGDLWVTQPGADEIGRLTPSGEVSEFSAGITPRSALAGITRGPEGDLWFVQGGGSEVGRITPDGEVSEFPSGLSSTFRREGQITAGAEGDLWFTLRSYSRVGRITPDGQIALFKLTGAREPFGITLGPEGNVWWTNPADDALEDTVTSGAGLEPTIAEQPQSRTVHAGEDTLLVAGCGGSPEPQETWELSTDGGAQFTPVQPGYGISYFINDTRVSESGDQYRVTCSSIEGSVTSSAATLTVLEELPPTISKLNPHVGPPHGGTDVAILGKSLANVSAVYFAGVPAESFRLVSYEKLTAVSPPGVSGDANVTVVEASGTSKLTAADEFEYGKPVIESISPPGGPRAGGTDVTVVGEGFAAGSTTTKFKFGKSYATDVTCESLTTCTMATPPSKKPGRTTVAVAVGRDKSAKSGDSAYTYE